MEMKASGSGEAVSSGGSAGGKKRPPSRLQKHAPASLQLEQAAAGSGPGAGPAAWGDGRAPIPLLSPLIVSPAATPVWEADQARGAARREGSGDQAEGRSSGEQQSAAAPHGGNAECQAHNAAPKTPAPTPLPAPGEGWQHPALPTPVVEPASLVPFFQSQCAVEVPNAQQ